jgi:hypothetical protein
MISKSDLAELRSAVLTGITIGVGSHILVFGNGVTLLIQCPFKINSKSGEQWGHGEDVATAPLLFKYLNHKIERAFMEEGEVLVLDFGGQESLAIFPDLNGLESYVLTTKFGVSPVLVI